MVYDCSTIEYLLGISYIFVRIWCYIRLYTANAQTLLEERMTDAKQSGSLDVSYMGIFRLPDIPDSIDDLSCEYNRLTCLPALPDSIATLWCDNNLLTSLPKLPASLTYLSCVGNRLTCLPELPTTLKYLSCDENFLTSLPNLPPSLVMLSCEENSLASLPDLPDTLSYLRCVENPYNRAFHILVASGYPIECIREYYSLTRLQNCVDLEATLGQGLLTDDCVALVGSFLSGKKGTLATQLLEWKDPTQYEA